ncbi:MAG: hypothetical protein BGO43_12550 [Gammaproteobacteria bacterium 39-13]|nr:hypothetical protein [Gammaproteobacteria bacterium]OJV89978.1 MAG: hypothetical protein BGO43_12550 [Gammaproteobacteria bacterium 39-13]
MDSFSSKVKVASFLFSALLATTASAGWRIQPSAGIDLGIIKQSFDTSFGENHFHQHAPNGNFYVGTKLYEYLNFSVGVEGGYEHRFRQQDQAFYPTLEDVTVPVLGFFNPLNPDPALYLSNVSAHAWHLNVEGFWAICPQTELTALLGVAWMTMYFDTVAISDPTVATPIARWNSGSHALFRMGIGIRQMITQHFGARLQATWENSSKLNATTAVPLPLGVASPQNLQDNYSVKPKNSYGASVGFFFQFA